MRVLGRVRERFGQSCRASHPAAALTLLVSWQANGIVEDSSGCCPANPGFEGSLAANETCPASSLKASPGVRSLPPLWSVALAAGALWTLAG